MKKKFFIVYMLLLGINRILSSSVFGDDIKKIFVLLFFFFLPLYSYAQITIEERVEIDPQSILPNYPEPQYTPCGPYPTQTDFDNPYQVIWNGGWLYIDPYQQLFNHQGNVYENYALSPQYTYDVEIIQGGEYCWIQKAGYTDQVAGEFIEPEIIGDQLMNISGEELIGTGQWLVLQGCWVDEKEFPSKYTIHFERDIPAGTEVIVRITGEGSTINYHTIVETPLLSIENGTELDTLYHYYGRWIDVLADLNESYYEGHPYCWKCGGELPSSVTFTLEVIQGQQYGSLYDVETDETGLSFSNIITETGKGSLLSYEYGYRFKFIADGVQPDITQPGIVTIRCTPSDGDINTIEFSFPVAYSEFPPQQGILVQFAEPVLAPGDTTQILLRRRNPDGTLEDFSQWDSFEIGMIEGCEAGEILVDTTLDVYFAQAYQPIKFVADGNITETDTVVVRVGLIELIIGKRAKTGRKEEEATTSSTSKNTEEPNPLLEKPTTYCFVGEIEWGLLGDGNAVVEVEEETIMLGETKYFQAKFNESEEKLEIVEIEDQLTGISQNEGPVDGEEGWEWVTEDIWGTDPATPVIEDNLSAVYWEKRYPVYIDNPGGNDHRDYVRSEALDDGLIRVIGRFWKEKESGENETEYKNKYSVKLTAKMNIDVVKTITLRVIKPDQLGSTHNQEKNVFGNFYNLDEQIIKYTGEYGIPPQFIKADIEAEGNFNPAYRYEPFYTINKLYKVGKNGKLGQVHDLLESSPYRITVDGKIYLDANNINGTADIGTIDGLEYHNYITNGVRTNGIPVTINGYPGYSGSIWDYFYANCTTVNPEAAYDIYPKLYPQWAKDAIRDWNRAYDENYEILKLYLVKGKKFLWLTFTDELIKDLSRYVANKWLKTKYRGGIFEKGIAQTRLGASYGLMQIIYPTANWKWQYNDKPEFLNENDINFLNAIPYLKEQVAITMNISLEDLDQLDQKNNFSSGIEDTYILSFNNYHGSDDENYGPKKVSYGHNI
jgi:hypothetical protein